MDHELVVWLAWKSGEDGSLLMESWSRVGSAPPQGNGNETWVLNTELDLERSGNAIGVCMGFKRVFTGFLIILSIVSDLGPAWLYLEWARQRKTCGL